MDQAVFKLQSVDWLTFGTVKKFAHMQMDIFYHLVIIGEMASAQILAKSLVNPFQKGM